MLSTCLDVKSPELLLLLRKGGEEERTETTSSPKTRVNLDERGKEGPSQKTQRNLVPVGTWRRRDKT